MSEIDDFLSAKPKTGGGSEIDSFLGPASPSPLRRIPDLGVAALKGAVALPESLVGLANIPTGGGVGRGAEALGVRFKDAQAALSDLYSPQQQAANRAVESAEGFVPTLGAALVNPSVIGTKIIESVPSMLGGAAIGRGAMALAPRLTGAAGAAIGEGVIAGGAAAEQIRQQTPDGSLSPGQAALAAGTGLATAAIGRGGAAVAQSKLGQRLGLTDVDTALVSGKLGPAGTAGMATRVPAAAVTEGTEELLQSGQEQAAQNLALGRPVGEGVGSAAAMGLLTGGVMGGGVNVARGKGMSTTTPENGPVSPQVPDTATQINVDDFAPAGPENPPIIVPPDRSAEKAAVLDAGLTPGAGPLSTAAAVGELSGANDQAAQVRAQAEQTANAEQDQKAQQAAQESLQEATEQAEVQRRGEVTQAVLSDKKNEQPTETLEQQLGNVTPDELKAVNLELRVRDQKAKEAERVAAAKTPETTAPAVRPKRAATSAPAAPSAQPAPTPAPSQLLEPPASKQSAPVSSVTSAQKSNAGTGTPVAPASSLAGKAPDGQSVLAGTKATDLASRSGTQPSAPATTHTSPASRVATPDGQGIPARPSANSTIAPPARADATGGGNATGAKVGAPQGLSDSPLSTGTGKVSPVAIPQPAQTDDEWLTALFSGNTTETPAAPNADDVDAGRIKTAIAATRSRNKAQYEDWAGRVYTDNKTQVEFRGDGPTRDPFMSIGGINEGRRRKALEALEQEGKALDTLDAIFADPAKARQFVGQLRRTQKQADEAIKSGNWPTFKNAGEMFESMLLNDILKLRGPGGRGNWTSNEMSKAMRAALEGESSVRPGPAPASANAKTGPAVESAQAESKLSQEAEQAPSDSQLIAQDQNVQTPEAPVQSQGSAPDQPGPDDVASSLDRTGGAQGVIADDRRGDGGEPVRTGTPDAKSTANADALKVAHERIIFGKAQTDARQRKIIDGVAKDAANIRDGKAPLNQLYVRQLQGRADTIAQWDKKTADAVRVLADHVDKTRPRTPAELKQQSAKVSKPPKPLAKIMVKVNALEADSGKKMQLTRPADQVLTDLDQQITTARALLECL